MKGNYILYLLNEVESELFTYAGNSNFRDLIKLLNILKKISERERKEELLKFTYILLKTKQFEKLGSYLLFVVKKAEENLINFDNLNDNLSIDKEFIKNLLLSIFRIKQEEKEEEVNLEIEKKNNQEILKNIEENKTIYETLESEFLNSKLEEVEEDSTAPKKLEITPEENLTKQAITDTKQIKEEEIEQITELESTAPLTLIKGDIKNNSEEVYNIPDEKEYSDRVKLSEESEDKIQANEEGFIIKKTFVINKEKKEVIKTESNKEIDNKQKAEIKKKIYIDHFDEDFSETLSIPQEENEKEVAKEMKITVENSKKESEENIAFKKYETELYKRNLVISEALGKLKETTLSTKEIIKKKETEIKHTREKVVEKSRKKYSSSKIDFKEDVEKEKILNDTVKNLTTLINSIISECDFMERYSQEMSFEIITNIYGAIKETMSRAIDELKEDNHNINVLDEEKIDLFIKGIILIRKLVAGEDYSGYENVVAEIEEIKNYFIKKKEEAEKKKKIQAEKEELEKKLSEKYADLTQRRKLLILKERILNVEKIFKSLDTIEGEYQMYNALTTLSRTFNHFRDIVKLSKDLKIDKMAKLSESSYIFIKFIQNYRMDPLSKEIKEILNYIIINLKLLFLDKKSKDLDLFISYLNNPEKIFS